MNRRDFLTMPAGFAFALQAAEEGKPRLKREDSFFGLHFDLHPSPSDKALGRDVSDDMVGRLLDRVRPDFVQYDSKGHPGWLAFPSQVGPSAPHIVKDSLEIWRRQTLQRGIALYIHFSGIWDSLAVERHPEWARVGPDGKADKDKTSTFGPYVDEWMIPELQEAATKYSLDGAWVDGECWAAAIDYSERAAKAWGKPMPRKPGEENWLEFLEFNRDQFRRYVIHYVEALKRTNPKFQIASNWLYSTFVPEKPQIPVAYLSGDYLGNAAISSARLEARYLAATSAPWDLMAWGFSWVEDNKFANVWKPAAQLQQESAVVLAQGGGFQVYYNPTRTGWIDDRLVDTMTEVSAFCRARQQFAHRSETVPQIGVVFSKHSLYNTTGKLFGGWGSAVHCVRGMLDTLIEAHYSVDVIPDWKLNEVAASYPLIVVPEWLDIGGIACRALRSYAQGGGRLLLLGAENVKLFAPDLGIQLNGLAAEQEALVPGRKLLGNVRGVWQPIAASGARVIGERFSDADTTRDKAIAATGTAFGKGYIGAIYGPVGTAYARTHDPATREFVTAVVDQIWKPDLQVTAPPGVEVVLRKKNGTIVLHLLNSTGMQVAADHTSVDYVAPVGPIGIAVRMAQKPKSVTVVPEGSILMPSVKENWVEVTLPKLDIHSMLVFET